MRLPYSKTALWLLNLTFAVPLVIYTVTAWIFTRHAYDDFCQAILPRLYGYWGGIQVAYETISGRLTAFTLNTAMANAGAPLGTFVNVALIFLWWATLFSLGKRWFRSKHSEQSEIIVRLQASLCATVLIVASIMILPNIHMALFAYNGTSIYLTPTVFFTVFMWYSSQPDSAHRYCTWVMCGLSALITALSLETSALVFVLMMCCSYIIYRLYFRHISTELPARLTVGFVMAALGLIIIAVAPAGVARSTPNTHPDIGLTVYISLTAFGTPLGVALLSAPLMVGTLILVGYSLGVSNAPLVTLKARRRHLIWIVEATIIAYVMIAVNFAPVAYFLHSGLIAHGWLPVAYTTVIWLTVISYLVGCLIKPPSLSKIGWMGMLVLVFGIVAIFQAWSTLTIQQSYATAWDARDAQLRQLVAEGVVSAPLPAFENPYYRLTPFPMPPEEQVVVVSSFQSFSPFKWEAEADPRVLTNVCMARYYGVVAISAQ